MIYVPINAIKLSINGYKKQKVTKGKLISNLNNMFYAFHGYGIMNF